VSINRRTAIAVRSIGVASAAAAIALGLAGNAFACSIADFSATVSCDTASGQGVIHVKDIDSSHTSATVTVFQGDQQVGTGRFEHPAVGDTIDISVPWSPKTTYRVHVKTDQNNVDEDVTKGSTTTGDEACAAPSTPTPSPSGSTTAPSQSPTTAPAAGPSSTATSAAPAVDDTNAPSPAAGGAQDLAETGGGSNTTVIAGVAAALVVVGGGAVFALRRRTSGARH
jgi:LPXTG-motif cell wall-anchored protein